MDAYRGQLVACLLHLRLPSVCRSTNPPGGGSEMNQTLVPVLGMPSVYGAWLHSRTHYSAVSRTLISCSHFSDLVVLVKRPIIMPHGLWDAQFGTNRGWGISRLSCAPGLGQ